MFFWMRPAKHPSPASRPRRHRLESLEARRLLTTTVTSLADSGAGTLRAAIATGGTINFQAGLNGTITLASPLTIAGNASIDAGTNAISVSGGNAVGVFIVNAGVTAALANVTITSGHLGAGNDGGGIQNAGTLTLTDCTISNNTATDGGGIINYATLTVNGCTFSGNQADPVSGAGGALWGFTNSVATVSNSTFTGNSAAYGAAIEYEAASPGQFTNDTFYNNTASGSQTGIVEVAAAAAEIDLTNCTVAGNTSGDSASGAVSAFNGEVKFANTISANNTVRQFVTNIGGTLVSLGHNLSSDGTGNLTATGDLANTNPLLGPLANYGGSTSTLALLPGSPAVDAGSTALAPAQDERGISRVGNADIGAFESRGFTLTATSGGGQTVNVGASFAALIATVSSAFSEPVQNGLVTFAAPAGGASATFAGSPATINASGQVTLTPQANLSAGSYSSHGLRRQRQHSRLCADQPRRRVVAVRSTTDQRGVRRVAESRRQSADTR